MKNKKKLFNICEKNSGRHFVVIARDDNDAGNVFWNNWFEYFDNNSDLYVTANEIKKYDDIVEVTEIKEK